MKKISTKWKIIILFLLIIFVILIPIGINQLYKIDKGYVYVTMWNAADVLSYYGSVLTFIGTAFLGVAVMYQNDSIDIRQNKMTSYSSLRLIKFDFSDVLDIKDTVMVASSMQSKEHPERLETRYLSLTFENVGKAISNSIVLHSMILKNIDGDVLIEFKETASNRAVKIHDYKYINDKQSFAKFTLQCSEDELSRIFDVDQFIKAEILIEYSNHFGVTTKGEYVSTFPHLNQKEKVSWYSDVQGVNYEEYSA